jgi:hypothetical protein
MFLGGEETVSELHGSIDEARGGQSLARDKEEQSAVVELIAPVLQGTATQRQWSLRWRGCRGCSQAASFGGGSNESS